MDHKIRAATLAAELRQTRERIAELEAENDRLGTAGMLARDWSRAWKRRAKMLRDDVRKCHGMANEINILTKAGRELGAENARLRRVLARLTEAASDFVAMRSGKRRRELSLAIAAARVALKGGEDA